MFPSGQPDHGSHDCGWTSWSYKLLDDPCSELYGILCEKTGGEAHPLKLIFRNQFIFQNLKQKVATIWKFYKSLIYVSVCDTFWSTKNRIFWISVSLTNLVGEAG